MNNMQDLRDDLIQKTHYLGAAGIREEVVWRKVGRENTLTESKLVPAPLTLIALLSAENCWLAPDGFWKGPTTYTPTFADFKMSCRLAVPELSPFSDDFTRVMQNVQWLMASIETKGNEKQGVFDPKETPFTTIKLRHVLFEKIKDNEGKNASIPVLKMLPNAIAGSDPDDFNIEDWPVQTEAARKGLSEMLTTHHVIPLPAYDHKGKLIQPTEYRAKLMGAIVRATVTLKHWNITARGDEARGRDTYTADIENLRVLV
ncbi:hypothetical protein C8R44DRAFT_667399, partial [Mycena epipterygia]